MSKKDNGWLYAVGLAAAAYFLFFKADSTSAQLPPTGSNGLKEGSRGEEVRRLQKAALVLGDETVKYILNNAGGADGIWGKQTSAAFSRMGWPEVVDMAAFDTYTRLAKV